MLCCTVSARRAYRLLSLVMGLVRPLRRAVRAESFWSRTTWRQRYRSRLQLRSGRMSHDVAMVLRALRPWRPIGRALQCRCKRRIYKPCIAN